MGPDWQTSLVAAGNTYNPCLIVLRQKGYALSVDAGNDAVLWSAKKGSHQFTGYSPPELLGLVVMWEHLSKDWNQQTPDILGELCSRMEA
jgi:hypothetical protein